MVQYDLFTVSFFRSSFLNAFVVRLDFIMLDEDLPFRRQCEMMMTSNDKRL